MAKFKFRVLKGLHRHGAPGEEVSHGPGQEGGQVIECDEPLDEMFENKFVRIAGPKSKKKVGVKQSASESLVDHQAYADQLNDEGFSPEDEEEPQPQPMKNTAPRVKGTQEEVVGEEDEHEPKKKPKKGAKPKRRDPDLDEDTEEEEALDEEAEDEEEEEEEEEPEAKKPVAKAKKPVAKAKKPAKPEAKPKKKGHGHH